MSNEHDDLFTGESFFAFSKKVFPKQIIVPYYLHCIEPDFSSKMPVFLIGYPALSYKATRLIDGKVKPNISYELFVAFKTPHITNFSRKTNDCHVLYGLENIQFLECTLQTHISQDMVEIFEFFLEQKMLRGFSRKDAYSTGAHANCGISYKPNGFRARTGSTSLLSLHLNEGDLTRARTIWVQPSHLYVLDRWRTDSSKGFIILTCRVLLPRL